MTGDPLGQGRLAPRDPALPSLAELFSPSRLALVAATVGELTGVPVEAAAGRVRYVRYRPVKSCVVLWSFPGPDGRPLLISGKLFPDDTGVRIVARPSFQRLARAAARYRYLPEDRLLLQVFPLDVRLPGLPLAASASWAAGNGGLAEDVLSADVIPSSYKPWRRCVFRYAIGEDGRRGHCFGKVFRDDRGALMLPRLRSLHAQLIEGDGPWGIAAPVAYAPEARVLLLAAVPDGVELKSVLRSALHDPAAASTLRAAVARAAEGLPVFHRTVVEGLPPFPPMAVLRRIRRSMGELDRVAPRLAGSIEKRLAHLESQAGRLPAEAPGPSHGAFRHDQLLLSGDRLVALDLDALCSAGAGADAGNFLAHLDLMAQRRPRWLPLLEECEEVFRAALPQRAVEHPGWVVWHRSAARITKALRCLFSLSPSWPEVTTGLLGTGSLAGSRRC